MIDLHDEIKVSRCISPTRVADNTAQVGQIIDGANFDALEYVIAIGTIADVDATFTVLLEEGAAANLSDAAAVADADMIGTEAGAFFQFDDDNEVRKLAYIGTKRYTRLTITPALNAGNADLSAVAVQSAARKLPRSSQGA